MDSGCTVIVAASAATTATKAAAKQPAQIEIVYIQ